jgi:uncharacterized BrkB/YihY/UPF0761 family membrane protein
MKRIVKVLAVLFTLISISRTVSIGIGQMQIRSNVNLFKTYSIVAPTLICFAIALACCIWVVVDKRRLKDTTII